MAETKYVVLEHSVKGEIMYIFGNWQVHRHAAGRMRNDFESVISAGFLRIQMFEYVPNDKLKIMIPLAVCYSESESLKKKSRPEEDSILACKTLNLVNPNFVYPESYLKYIRK